VTTLNIYVVTGIFTPNTGLGENDVPTHGEMHVEAVDEASAIQFFKNFVSEKFLTGDITVIKAKGPNFEPKMLSFSIQPV
jgi:hypothetical protein